MTENILENLKSPDDLNDLSLEELQNLSLEARNRIINTVSKTGGHLASSLGVVDLTIALHTVFNSPKDKIIFDTSHQCYTHKLLTGRNKDFDGLRQYHGISGFTNPDESEHDTFFAGHAGTALSSALGLVLKRDYFGTDEHIIPIIGDASLTCGLTLEALNNIKPDMKNFTIILNDNNMAISKNVGAVSNILSRLLSNPKMTKFYHEVEGLLSKIPSYGKTIAHQGKQIKNSIQNLVSPATFFEHYGISYLGPFDGHNIPQMIEVLEEVRNYDWPVILHFLTQKGKGLEEAEKDPTAYHGAKPFNPDTGKFLPSTNNKPSFPSIFGKQILKMADTDDKIYVVTPAMLAGSGLNKFMEKHPKRCLDVGIAEGHAVTVSGGLAQHGDLKVCISIYSSFLQRAFDNLYHDVCLQNLPVLFCIDRSGFSAADGATHHGIYDISFLNSMPNIVITQARDGKMLRKLMNSAFDWKSPAAIRYPNLTTDDYETEDKVDFARGELLNSTGEDILIIALGHMSQTALEVQELLKKKDIGCSIIDPIFIKPLDKELIENEIKKHRLVVTIEEHSIIGGLGSIINNFIISNKINKRVVNFAIPERFIEQGGYKDLIEEVELSSNTIYEKINTELKLLDQ